MNEKPDLAQSNICWLSFKTRAFERPHIFFYLTHFPSNQSKFVSEGKMLPASNQDFFSENLNDETLLQHYLKYLSFLFHHSFQS